MTWLAESLLTVLAAAPVERAVADLAAQLGRDRHAIDQALVVLHRRELVERVALGVYRLTDAGRALLADGGAVRAGAPGQARRAQVRGQTLRHRLWTALAHRRKATLPELLTLVVAGGERNAEHNARRYLRLLERTGYLLRLPTRAPGMALTSPGYLKWVVLRWTGPRAPVVRAHGAAVYDPNLGQTFIASPSPLVGEGRGAGEL